MSSVSSHSQVLPHFKIIMNTLLDTFYKTEYSATQNREFSYTISRIPFDENYCPSENTRITTNFANLARGDSRQENLRNTLKMMNSRLNDLAYWDNSEGDRYSLDLEIISVAIELDGDRKSFPSVEILKADIIDRKSNKRIEGIVGNNFSSYVRDYDFSVRLPEHNRRKGTFSIPHDFGDLHGKLFQDLVHSETYRGNFKKLPVICLSVSNNQAYSATANKHPVLGLEYTSNKSSLTERYFKKMGLQVRYFMPLNTAAPLAFYFFGDLLNDYSNIELISTISTMETFQKIYRPEIYNANTTAGTYYQPNLKHTDYSLTQIFYDRAERSQLAISQGQFAEKHFIKPYQARLDQWLQTTHS
jgi:hypothetical protein